MSQLPELRQNETDFYEILLSETKDFGIRELSSIQSKRKILQEALDISALQGAFTGVPAIIIGAGPSLDLDGKDLDPLIKNSALILSGGSALEWVQKKGITPHFSLLFDPNSNHERFLQVQEEGHRAIFTLRASTPVVLSWKGPKWLLSTEAFHLWESAWHPTESILNVGWNVATALGAFARFLGCTSLFFIGVDLDVGKEGEIYPEGILTTKEDEERECRQLEWQLARDWLSSFSEKSSQEGTQVFFGENSLFRPGKKLPFKEFAAKYAKQTCLIEEIIQAHEKSNRLLTLPLEEFEERMSESYLNTKNLLETYLATEAMETIVLEPFYQKILSPLWKIWAPRFAEACLERDIPWMEKEQEIAFIFNVLNNYQELL